MAEHFDHRQLLHLVRKEWNTKTQYLYMGKKYKLPVKHRCYKYFQIDLVSTAANTNRPARHCSTQEIQKGERRPRARASVCRFPTNGWIDHPGGKIQRYRSGAKETGSGEKMNKSKFLLAYLASLSACPMSLRCSITGQVHMSDCPASSFWQWT